jgi:hypothetical protein
MCSSYAAIQGQGASESKGEQETQDPAEGRRGENVAHHVLRVSGSRNEAEEGADDCASGPEDLKEVWQRGSWRGDHDARLYASGRLDHSA